MCTVLFSYKTTPGYRLVLAANRDEFFERPSEPLSWWDDSGEILAGRDLRGGGTWLGVARSGKYGVLTNYREVPQVPDREKAVSRGVILPKYFRASQNAAEFLDALKNEASKFRGFNLLVGDEESLGYYSNRNGQFQELPPGIYGLSNHLLDSPWPKVERGKMLLRQVLSKNGFSTQMLEEVLSDTRQPEEHTLPDTGIGREWETKLAPNFFSTENYGTGSSAILPIENDGRITFSERTFVHGTKGAQTETQRCFTIE